MRAESRGRITSLHLLATLLLMQLRMGLVFWAMSTHCWVILGFSSSNTPGLSPQRGSQSILCSEVVRIALTQVQDLAHGLVEPHEVGMGPFTSLSINLWLAFLPYNLLTTQLGATSRLAEGTLNPTVPIADEDA